MLFPLKTKLPLTLWPTVSVSISSAYSSLPQVSVASDSGRRRTAAPLSEQQGKGKTSHPSPSRLFSNQVLSEWLCKVHLTAALCAPGLWKKSQTADSFDRWLWNGACLLWLRSAINSSMLFTCPSEDNTSRARSWGWQGKPSATRTHISRD